MPFGRGGGEHIAQCRIDLGIDLLAAVKRRRNLKVRRQRDSVVDEHKRPVLELHVILVDDRRRGRCRRHGGGLGRRRRFLRHRRGGLNRRVAHVRRREHGRDAQRDQNAECNRQAGHGLPALHDGVNPVFPASAPCARRLFFFPQYYLFPFWLHLNAHPSIPALMLKFSARQRTRPCRAG